MSTGYSGKSLRDKLGIREGFTIIFINPPQNFFNKLGAIDFPVQVKDSLSGKFDFIHFFTHSKSDLERNFPNLIDHLYPTGMIWISWPKKSSNVETDITENTLREIGLPLGVVDIKVIAVDDTWSGLKFVIRKTKNI